jgi:hypothetical protein
MQKKGHCSSARRPIRPQTSTQAHQRTKNIDGEALQLNGIVDPEFGFTTYEDI